MVGGAGIPENHEAVLSLCRLKSSVPRASSWASSNLQHHLVGGFCASARLKMCVLFAQWGNLIGLTLLGHMTRNQYSINIERPLLARFILKFSKIQIFLNTTAVR